jgi:hypothetical protein
MKVSELIKLLQLCDQEADVNFQVGNSDFFRKLIAKLVSEDDGTEEHDGLGCLQYMCIDVIKQTQYVHAETSEINIILGQNFYKDSYFEDLVIANAKRKEDDV